MELYPHQKYEDGMYFNSFMFVHDDTFWRSFKCGEEIHKYFENIGVECVAKIVSFDSSNNINVFIITLKTEQPINSVEELEEFSHEFDYMSNKYYECVPIDFNAVL